MALTNQEVVFTFNAETGEVEKVTTRLVKDMEKVADAADDAAKATEMAALEAAKTAEIAALEAKKKADAVAASWRPDGTMHVDGVRHFVDGSVVNGVNLY